MYIYIYYGLSDLYVTILLKIVSTAHYVSLTKVIYYAARNQYEPTLQYPYTSIASFNNLIIILADEILFF